MAGLHLYDESKLPEQHFKHQQQFLVWRQAHDVTKEKIQVFHTSRYNKNYIVLPVHIDQMRTKIHSKHLRKNVINDTTHQFIVEWLRKNFSLYANDDALIHLLCYDVRIPAMRSLLSTVTVFFIP